MIQAIPTRNPETSQPLKTLLALELIGQYAITLDDGYTVYNELYPLLSNGFKVTLDFQGITHFGAPFMNAAIGGLLAGFSIDFLKTNLITINLTSAGQGLLERVIIDSNDYYTNPLTRAAVDRVLHEQSIAE
jgi:hypothetical protein